MFEQLVTNFFLLSDVKQLWWFFIVLIGFASIVGGIQAIIEHAVINRGLIGALWAIIFGGIVLSCVAYFVLS